MDKFRQEVKPYMATKDILHTLANKHQAKTSVVTCSSQLVFRCLCATWFSTCRFINLESPGTDGQ